MLKGTENRFEIHAFGKKQVKNADILCDKINKWIKVDKIESGKTKKDGHFIIVYFERVIHLHEAYMEAKVKASRIAAKKTMIDVMIEK